MTVLNFLFLGLTFPSVYAVWPYVIVCNEWLQDLSPLNAMRFESYKAFEHTARGVS